MLVCNVSLRPPRSAIAASLTEATTAADAAATGNVVFATLVDDPASVGDIVDAYLGEIMLEAASAADTVEVVGGVYAGAVAEAATAVDAMDGTVPVAIRFYDFALKTSIDVAPAPRGAIPEVTASADGRYVLFDTVDEGSTALTAVQFRETGK